MCGPRGYNKLTFDLRTGNCGVDTHILLKKVNQNPHREVDNRYRTSKHCESPVEDCLATWWRAETYEVARRAVRANRGVNRIVKGDG